MKVRVKLYGTLSLRFPGYEHPQGLAVEIPDDGKVEDLLSLLRLPKTQRTVVVVGGRIMTLDDALNDGAFVSLLQPFSGG